MSRFQNLNHSRIQLGGLKRALMVQFDPICKDRDEFSYALDLQLALSPTKTKAILENTSLFFIVGMGRSGTVFLSHLLNKITHVAFYHEAGCDFKALVEAYWKLYKAISHLEGSRRRLIVARIVQTNCQTYGEVNGVLRYHVDVLQSCWKATTLHLVRNGRFVVRSIMNLRAFTPSDEKVTGQLEPRSDDPLAERWLTMDRFERVCWYWSHAVKYLLERNLPLIRLEDVVSFYGQFTHQVLTPLGVSLPYGILKIEAAQPKNVSKRNRFPSWKDWTRRQKHQFEVICGPVMTLLGYQT